MTEYRLRKMMTAIAVAAAALALGGCGAAATASPAAAEKPTEREIAALFDGWNAALATGDADQVVARYGDNAVLLPTLSPGVLDSPGEIREYFVKNFLPKKPSGVITESVVRVLDENTALHSGLYTFTVTGKNGAAEKVKARFTFVYERSGAGWKIVEHQSSLEPGSA